MLRVARLPSPTSRFSTLRQLRRAQGLASAVLAAFVVTFLAAPCLHNLDHRPDHTHGDDGVQEEAWDHTRQHLTGHAHHHAGRPRAKAPGRLQFALAAPPAITAGANTADEGAPPPPHGNGALAHFGAVVLPTPIHVAIPPFQPSEVLAASAVPKRRPRTAPRGLPGARAPPQLISNAT